MPKTIYIPRDATSSGISVEWTKSSDKLYISGWYDGCVGIEGQEFSLAAFLLKLGIGEKEVSKSFKRLRGL